MTSLNIEIKARVDDLASIRSYLLAHGADFRGEDHQIDTYFTVPHGRLKIRRGTVESCIVHYDRPDTEGPKACRYRIEHFTPGDPALDRLHDLLAAALGILVEVDKRREIWFIGNIKFHLDRVSGLGTFFEIEAIGDHGQDESELRRQCGQYLSALGIDGDRLVDCSYSDLLMKDRPAG